METYFMNHKKHEMDFTSRRGESAHTFLKPPCILNAAITGILQKGPISVPFRYCGTTKKERAEPPYIWAKFFSYFSWLIEHVSMVFGKTTF